MHTAVRGRVLCLRHEGGGARGRHFIDQEAIGWFSGVCTICVGVFLNGTRRNGVDSKFGFFNFFNSFMALKFSIYRGAEGLDMEGLKKKVKGGIGHC